MPVRKLDVLSLLSPECFDSALEMRLETVEFDGFVSQEELFKRCGPCVSGRRPSLIRFIDGLADIEAQGGTERYDGDTDETRPPEHAPEDVDTDRYCLGSADGVRERRKEAIELENKALVTAQIRVAIEAIVELSIVSRLTT